MLDPTITCQSWIAPITASRHRIAALAADTNSADRQQDLAVDRLADHAGKRADQQLRAGWRDTVTPADPRAPIRSAER